jgi:hypothetical protein
VKPKTIRIGVLLAVLAVVLVHAARDVLARRSRNEWRRTLDVALVVVTEPGTDSAAIAELRSRTSELARRLTAEFRHYRPDGPPPFAFVHYGPVPLDHAVPVVDGDGLGAAARYAWDLHGFTRDTDVRAGVPSGGFDARLYLVVRPPSERGVVEGAGEHGGRVGIARADLTHRTLDLALFVAAHELFHTLGATDHYGPDGRALVPEGLAEPELTPQFPQRKAELMARNRPVSAREERRPESLDELGVGPSTAREVGWTK